MKIGGFGTVTSSKSTKKTQSKPGARSFANVLDTAETNGASSSSANSEVAAAGPVAGLLGLQEISDEQVRRERTLKRGNEMLDTLDDLRKEILVKGANLQTMQRINKQLSDNKQQFMDEQMREVMEDIELRAAVELAKLEKARDDKLNN